MAGWYAPKYWATHYWHANYWALTATATGGWWHTNYWATNYWRPGWWAGGSSLPTGGNRNAVISGPLGPMAGALRATTSAGIHAQLAPLLAGVTALFRGTPIQATPFDLDVRVTAAAVAKQFTWSTGTWSTTLDPLAFAGRGQFVAPAGRVAQLASTLAGAGMAAAGTSVAPPSRRGSIVGVLGDAAGAFSGLVVQAQSRLGQLNGALAGANGALVGHVSVPTFAGSLNASLDGAASRLIGLAVIPGANLGQIDAFPLEDAVLAMEGVLGVFEIVREHLETEPEQSAFETTIDPIELEAVP